MRQLDPRIYQISVLAGLLVFGLTRLGFYVTTWQCAAVIAVAVLTQRLCSRFWRVSFEWKSSVISGLSICLLLRAETVLLLLGAAAIAVASKFVIRVRGKHLFNPTNLAIAVLLIATDKAWISPGQWGSHAFFAFLMACAGGLVANRAVRSDVTYAFIAAYFSLVVGRALWLGDPLSIPLHKLQNGSLLLFAFFMISDPKTTPDTRLGRIIFAIAVAVGGWYLQWKYWIPEGLLLSLVFVSLLVPLIDLLFRGARFEWTRPQLSTSHVQLAGSR